MIKQFKEEPTYEEIDIAKDSLDFGRVENYAFDLDREETCYRGKNPDVTKRKQKAKQVIYTKDYSSFKHNKPMTRKRLR